MRPEGLDKLIKLSYLIRSRTRDLPPCRAVLHSPRQYCHNATLINLTHAFDDRKLGSELEKLAILRALLVAFVT
jgi:hypothetical protein